MNVSVAASDTESGGPKRRAFRQAAFVVGAVSACFVVLSQVVPTLLVELLALTASDPATSNATSWITAINEFLWFLSTSILPVVAVLLAFYLTAGRELPVAPVAAGAFVGASTTPIGYVLGTVYLRPIDLALLSADAFFSFATLTLTFVVPVLLAVLFGAVIDDLWQYAARWRGLRSY